MQVEKEKEMTPRSWKKNKDKQCVSCPEKDTSGATAEPQAWHE